MPCREGTIEIGIMSNHLRIADKRRQARKRFTRRRRIGNILIMDVGKMRDVVRNGFSGVHEGYVPINDLPAIHPCCSDLGQFVVIEREARRFSIDHNDISIQIPEVLAFGD